MNTEAQRSRATHRRLLRSLTREFEHNDDERDLLNHIDQAILNRTALEVLFDDVCRQTKQVLNASATYITYRIEDDIEIVASSERHTVGLSSAYRRPYDRALSTGYVTLSGRAAANLHGALVGAGPQNGDLNPQSVVLARMDGESEPFATLVVVSNQSAFFHERKPLILALANQLSIAIRHGDLVNREAISKLYDEIDSDFFAVEGGQDVVLDDKTLDSIAKALLQLLPRPNNSVQILFPDAEDALKVVYSTDMRGYKLAIRTSASVSGRAFTEHKMQMVRDVESETEYAALLGTHLMSECAVPVLIGRQVVAVINVESPRRNGFAGYSAHVIEHVARKTAYALAFVRVHQSIAEYLERRHAVETFIAMGMQTADVLHRVNSDLGAIRALVRRLPREGEKNTYAIENLSRVIDGASSNVERFKTLLQDRDVDVNQDIQLIQERTYIESGFSIETQLEPNLPKIHGLLIREALENVINNALQALAGTDGPRRVKIETSSLTAPAALNGFVKVVVSDTGSGIDPSFQAKIFEPGATTKHATEARSGLGLGLFLARIAVLRAGGEISVESEPGLGTTVEIIFPISKSVR